MPSITTWTRLEPWTRQTDISKGLAAQVHDPLWLLARQWQLGEFQAEDAGTPVSVRVRGEVSKLDRVYAGPIADGVVQGHPYDSNRPLEQSVEREPTLAQASPREMVDGSLQFFRCLKAHNVGHYREAYINQYLLPDHRTDYQDIDSDRYLHIVSSRTLNSRLLYGALSNTLKANPPTLPMTPTITSVDQAAVIQAATSWLTWYEDRYGVSSPGSDAWMPERMEHAFAVSTASNQGGVYAAHEYHGGHLDWYHFNQTQTLTIDAETAEASMSQSYVRTVIPSPVSFRGMPEGRWWSFEDAEVNLGRLDAGKEDLGRLLLLQYALAYSDDWFLMPLELDIGAVLTVHSFVVTDTFGVRTLIKPFDDVDSETGAWQMFTYAMDGGSKTSQGNQLFLPPTLPSSLHGQPLEEVHLLRDEMANVAWAVEHKVENARGQAYHRHETGLMNPVPPEGETFPPEAELVYHLMNQVPAHWIPLIPVLDRQDNTAIIRLQRGRMLTIQPDDPLAPGAKGRLLAPGRPLMIENEEIEKAGAHITRAYQFTRWTKGRSFLWIARHKRIGRGEGWSGLRFDTLDLIPDQVLDAEPVPSEPVPSEPPPEEPTLLSLNPASTHQGETVMLTITGTNMANVEALTFSGTGLTVRQLTILNAENMTAELAIANSAPPGSRTFQLVTPTGTVESQIFDLSFEVLEVIPEPVLPTLTRISPTSARRRDTITLRLDGSGLSEITQVRFVGGGVTSRLLRIINDQRIEVRLSISSTSSLGNRTLELLTPSGTIRSDTFGIRFNVRSAPSRPPTSPSGSSGNRAIGGNLL